MHQRKYLMIIWSTLTALVLISLLGLELWYGIWGILALTVVLQLLTGSALYMLYRGHPQPEPEEPIGWRHDNRQLLGFIERLLKGCENQRISGIQIPTYSPFFVVFGVDIVTVSQEDTACTEELARAELEICNALAVSFSHHYFWPMNIDGRLICVVNLWVNPADPLQEDAMDSVVLPLFEKTISELNSRGIQIRIATSGPSVGTESLSTAYQDIAEIFDQLLLRSPNDDISVILVNPRQISNAVDHVTRSQTERLFCNYISVQNFDNACLALLKLLTYEEREQAFSTILKQLTSNRLEWALAVLSGTMTQTSQQLLRQKIIDMNNAAYFKELRQQITEWFSLLSKSVVPQSEGSVIPQVMAYITENCFQAELNVAMLSEHFHLNASYLSNSFHTQTGIRLTDFIHQQRLKKVKQLLKETDLPISEIAGLTGYYSAIALSRVFKRYEGITPSAYRNA